MEKNLPFSVVVLLTVWSLAACGSDTTARSIEASRNDSATTISSAEVTSTVEVAEEVDTVATVEAVDGFTFTPPSGDYSVVFPSEPTANDQTVKLADGTSIPLTFYLTDSDHLELGTAATTYPPGSVVSLEGARDGAISNISGTQTSSDPINLQGREGLQFTASVKDGQVTYLARVYDDDVTLYQVFAVVLGDVAFDDPEIAAFFDSFRFTVDI
ncbi:MAG: hypothetical protein QOJ66_1624 [Ilumatobacteraceae bacterium]